MSAKSKGHDVNMRFKQRSISLHSPTVAVNVPKFDYFFRSIAMHGST